jgi:excisionase family DNA binding protein
MATVLDREAMQGLPPGKSQERAPAIKADELPVVLTIKQLREVLQISRPKAYELAHQAGFPSVRFGRTIRIPRDALLRWLEKGGNACA